MWKGCIFEEVTESFEYIKSEELLFEEIKIEESENSENEYWRVDLTFVLSIWRMLQLCVAYIGIQISYHFGVDLLESLFWRAWQRIYIQIFFMSAVTFDTVEQFFSKSSLQNKPKCMRKNSTGLWLFLCTWMIMTDSVMLSKAVFNGKYPTHPCHNSRCN